MTIANRNEIEYLGSLAGTNGDDAKLIHELSRRLDALRRYDQHVSAADWRPRTYRLPPSRRGKNS